MPIGVIRSSLRALRAAAPIAFACGSALAQIPRDTTPIVAKTSPQDIAAGKVLCDASGNSAVAVHS